MIHQWRRTLTVVSLTTLSFLASSAPGAPVERPELKEKLRKLSSDSFPEREKTMRELAEIGDDILPYLKPLKNSGDPEVQWRARFLETRLLTGVSEESPEKIRELVDQFSDADLNRRRQILKALLAESAWQPVFGLFTIASAESPEIVAQLSDLALPAIQNLVRDAILEEDFGRAEYFLENGATFPAAKRHYGAYLVEKGQALPKDASTEIELTYLIQKGEFDKARKLAEKFGLSAQVRNIAIAQGDAIPLLKFASSSPNLRPSTREIAQFFLAEQEGDAELAEQWRVKLLAEAQEILDSEKKERGSLQNHQLMFDLAAIGEMEKARQLFGESFVDQTTVRYFEFRMELDKVFRQIGLNDTSDEGIREWYSSVNLLSPRENFSLDRQASIVMFYLLEQGKGELVKELIDGSIKANQGKFAKVIRDTVIDQLGVTGFTGEGRPDDMHRLLFDLACDAIDANDEIDLKAMAARLLRPHMNASMAVPMVYDLSVKAYPDIDKKERLKRVTSVLRYSIAPEEERLKWVADLTEVATEQEGDSLKTFAGHLLSVGDLASAWSIYEDKPELLEAGGRSLIARYLLVQENWEALRALDFAPEEVGFSRIDSMRIRSRILSQSDKAEDQAKAKKLRSTAELMLLGGQDETLNAARENYRLSEDEEFLNRLKKFTAAGQLDRSQPEQIDLESGLNYPIQQVYIQLLIEEGRYKEAAASAQARLLYLASPEYWNSYRGRAFYALVSIEQTRNLLDFATGMQLLEEGKRKEGIKRITAAVKGEGVASLGADLFFPILAQRSDLKSELDQWYADVDQTYVKVFETFPESPTHLNGRAWLAARAGRNLGVASQCINLALEKTPGSGPMTDTLAEVYFAKGDRKKALEVSERAITLIPLDSSLRRQLHHFKTDPFPKKSK